MRIALHGVGKMGKAVERVALERGHEIVRRFDQSHPVGAPELSNCDVVIDFSIATTLQSLVAAACRAAVPAVIGTTGWNDQIADVRQQCEAAGIAIVYAANFSPGANVAFSLARRAAEMFASVAGYEAGIEERHHSGKKDAPSGTALRLQQEVTAASDGSLNPAIASSRVGKESGVHTVFFDSADDVVEIVHRARGREGFARGAVLAAESISGRKGLFRFDELLAL